MLRLGCTLTASSLLLLVSFAANASPITINNSNIEVLVYHNSAGSDYNTDTSTTYGSRSLLTTNGFATARTDSNWVATGSGALIDFDVSNERSGAQNTISAASDSWVTFTADENTTYDISGQYTVDDVSSSDAGQAFSRVYLLNVTASSYLLYDEKESRHTTDESFTVGAGGGGDLDNFFTGSVSGDLIAGNQYRFYFKNVISAPSAADGGASATGCVTLSIGGATGAGSCGISSVPEPMPLLLLGAGLAALGLRRRFRVKAA